MHMQQYHAECGATAACTLRLTQNQPDDEDWIVLQDAWFGGFKNAEALWSRRQDKAGKTFSTSIVKTHHAKFPKEFVLQQMKGKKRGEHVALHYIGGTAFVAIGYVQVQLQENCTCNYNT